MLKVASRKDLDGLTGKPVAAPTPAPVIAKPAIRAKPAPAPVNSVIAPHPGIAELHTSIAAIGKHLERTTELLARQSRIAAPPELAKPLPAPSPKAVKPSKLDAVVTRDKAGRISGAVVTNTVNGKKLNATVMRGADGKVEKVSMAVADA